MSRRRRKQQSKTALKQELKNFDRLGVSLILEGNPSRPNKIVKACTIAEKGTYMRDYVANEKGVICEVHFDLIRHK